MTTNVNEEIKVVPPPSKLLKIKMNAKCIAIIGIWIRCNGMVEFNDGMESRHTVVCRAAQEAGAQHP